MTPADLKQVDQIVEGVGRGEHAVIPVLQAIQSHFGYLPEDALRRVCEVSDITPASIEGVASFYSQFRRRPVGTHRVKVCHGTACHVKGAQQVTDAIRKYLAIADDDDTDESKTFTVEKVACLGCCTLAPVVQIDDVTYGHLAADGVGKMLRDFLEYASHKRQATDKPKPPPGELAEIRVGLGSCCVARGSGKVYEAIQQTLTDTHARAEVKMVGCVGMCHQTPLLEIVEPGGRNHLYAQVQGEDVRAILARHLQPTGPVRKIRQKVSAALENLLTDEAWQPVERYTIEVRDPPVEAFLGPQQHIATEHCGVVHPTDLEDYRRRDGFAALGKCLAEMSGEQIIDAVSRSGLRGRGGAGFHTGTKWATVRAADGQTKYVVCNGDEGDPGAFMDRMLLESYPYRVIEGLTIAAYATGAHEAYFYVRAEYPLAVQRIRQAIDSCRAANLLGENILASGFSLDVRVMEGAGAFVCGEETALLASIEGRRGTPRLRPPYPAVKGLWGAPTLVNNVETYALVPWIVRHGPEQLAKIGRGDSKGTKVFALAGKVARGGLIEVPMGTTIGQIVEEIGGGIENGKAFKAVQIGGPSGGCVPATLGDTPIDFEALGAVGAIMGSGGLVVLDEDDCMVEIARYFLEFTQDQSCGKCTFCRIGTRRMLDILTRLCSGQGQKGDLEKLETLAHQVQAGSLCGLGQTAPNPVLSTLTHFRDEYEAHLQGRCPARSCRTLIMYSINDDCIGCTLCSQHCPVYAIEMRPCEQHEIDTDKCIRCGACREICPVDAVDVE